MGAISAGCSHQHYVVNPPLTQDPGARGYAMRHLEHPDNSDSLLILMAISGGGYRAATLGYEVLDQMRRTPIVWEGQLRSLLDELDFLSGVSGGSLIAGYYALHRAGTFDTFESDVLSQDMQAEYLGRVLSMRGLWLASSPHFGRGDLLAEVLHEHGFAGRSFGDLPRQRPLVFINATDMQHGSRFEFTQDQFDLLCADLNRFPVERAVAASMAVPLVMSPISLWNHRQKCQVQRPQLPTKSLADRSRFVHLVDGGLADNTGIQTALELIEARGGIVQSARVAGLHGIRRRVFIVVNAQLPPSAEIDDHEETPSLVHQLASVIDLPIDRYSSASLELLRRDIALWRAQLAFSTDEQLGGTIARDTEFHVIEISLSAPPPGVAVPQLSSTATALRISTADRQKIHHYVQEVLQADPEWQRLLQTLGSNADANTPAPQNPPRN